MSESDKVSQADLLEMASLQRTISDIERQAFSLPLGIRPFFNNLVDNAKARIGVLEKKVQDAEREQQAKEATRLAVIADAARKEIALSNTEKETYNRFLAKEFFTKKDFATLEQFYSTTWNRLSQEGKDQLSQRIWDGVRHGEYRFSDLPKPVKEKETKQAYETIRNAGVANHIENLPQKDRDDFVRAYEAGRRDEAEKVLERDSFKKTLFRNVEPDGVKHVNAEIGRKAESKAIVNSIATNSVPSAPQDKQSQEARLARVNLEGLTLAEASEPSAAAIPKNPAGAAKDPALVRGG